MTLPESLRDLATAEAAFIRVQPELEALTASDLAPLNTDVVSATAIALGVAERVRGYRERIAKLPEFDVKHVDNLVDYVLAAWFAYVTNLPKAEPADAELLLAELVALRTKLLRWAAPLAAEGYFEQAAVDHIKEGSGQKDAASDVVALVGLYRSRWDEVSGLCGVTEANLVRAAEIGPAVFALVSQRENKLTGMTDSSLRVRRAWTLVDRAYAQCQRALHFLIFDAEELSRVAPSLRRNAGPRQSNSVAEPAPPIAAPASAVPSSVGSTPPVSGTAAIGGGASPFAAAAR